MDILRICGDISNVIATALAAVSIYLMCIEQKKARAHEKNRNIVEQKLLWYNEVVLNDIIKDMNEFVNEGRRQLEHCKLQNNPNLLEKDLKEIYCSLNNQFKSIKEKIFLLRTFSNFLYKTCDEKLQIIFDIYSNVINEAIKKKYICYINDYEIQKNKGDIFSALFKWANDFIETEE